MKTAIPSRPAWRRPGVCTQPGVGLGRSRTKQYLEMRNNPCPNTQQRGVFPLVPTRNKGSVVRTWKDKSFSALLDSVWWKCCCLSAAGIPSWSPPSPGACLQVTSDFTVPGPGGLGDISPSGNLSGPLSATAPCSHWLPVRCGIQKRIRRTLLTGILMLIPPLSCTVCLKPTPPGPSLCRLAQPLRWGTRSALPSPSHSAQRWWHRGHQDPEGWTHSSPRGLCDGPGMRLALCSATSSDCRDLQAHFSAWGWLCYCLDKQNKQSTYVFMFLQD